MALKKTDRALLGTFLQNTKSEDVKKQIKKCNYYVKSLLQCIKIQTLSKGDCVHAASENSLP